MLAALPRTRVQIPPLAFIKYHKPATVLLAFTVLIAPATAEVEISPSEYELDLVAGENHIEEAILYWDGDNPADIVLDSSVYPESEEIEAYTDQVTYSLEPGEAKHIQIFVDTSPYTGRGDYTVSTETRIVAPILEEYRSGGSNTITITEDGERKTITREDWENIAQELQELEQERQERLEDLEDFQERIEELEKDLNETEELQQDLDEKESELEDQKNTVENLESRIESMRTATIILALLLLILVAGSAYILNYRPELVEKYTNTEGENQH